MKGPLLCSDQRISVNCEHNWTIERSGCDGQCRMETVQEMQGIAEGLPGSLKRAFSLLCWSDLNYLTPGMILVNLLFVSDIKFPCLKWVRFSYRRFSVSIGNYSAELWIFNRIMVHSHFPLLILYQEEPLPFFWQLCSFGWWILKHLNFAFLEVWHSSPQKWSSPQKKNGMYLWDSSESLLCLSLTC